MRMTSWGSGEGIEEGLSALRVHDADPERVERIRARCVSVLASQRRRAELETRRAVRGWTAWLEPVLAFGLGALFLAEAVTRALSVYR